MDKAALFADAVVTSIPSLFETSCIGLTDDRNNQNWIKRVESINAKYMPSRINFRV